MTTCAYCHLPVEPSEAKPDDPLAHQSIYLCNQSIYRCNAALKLRVAELENMLQNYRDDASKLEDRENAAPLIQTAED
jgi:hypothetical protein